MSEEWRPVVGWEGLYEVSSCGRVRSLDRMCVRAAAKGGGFQKCRGRILKPRSGKHNTRLSVQLARDGSSGSVTIHRLVARAFLGDCPAGCEVNHMDGDHQNNHASNLEYCTHQENQAHAARLGLMKPPRLQGERHGRSRLTCNDVAYIRSVYTSAEKKRGLITVLALKFGVGTSAIAAVISGRNWKAA